jgi:2,3-bisphosphoglycerate-independent phosphoglycerate mutase
MPIEEREGVVRRSLLLFIDGVGLGDADPERNAFVVARLPTLSALLAGGQAVRGTAPYHGDVASLVALDASLGISGLPQSGTGQSALLTGKNTAQLYGRHFGPWIPTPLRALVREENLLARARASGRSIAFANAYPEEILAQAVAGAASARLPSFLRAGPPLAAMGAGVLERGTPALERGDAVASEITNEGWRQRLGRSAVPLISAADAGRNLARITGAHDLTLFAHYTTDYAGHERDLAVATAALERVDAFLGGLLPKLRDTLLIVASDHGNIEDARASHTLNPAIALVIGDGHESVARSLADLTHVAPALLRGIGVR